MPADGQTDEEWTRVKTKTRRRQVPRKAPAATTKKAAPDAAPSTLTVADIEAEYETFRLRWQDGEASRRLKDTIDSNAASGKAVRNAVCLGIGTFDPDHGGWDAKRRTYIQLVAFLDMVKHICTYQYGQMFAEYKYLTLGDSSRVLERPHPVHLPGTPILRQR
jgi:hypothetical protein